MGELNGILNVNKPAGITSARAVGQVKRLLPRGTKVGHAGTLDPIATGVLLILIGRATKRSESLMSEPKQYEVTVRFGATTETDDLDSPPTPYPQAIDPTRERLLAALPGMTGTILQRPPVYSALKIGGRRACDRARDGQAVPLVARPVRIDRIELLDLTPPDARLRIDCGRGTYIRAIARDLGEALHCGGYLTQLCRTRVGPFAATDGLSVAQMTPDSIRTHLHSL
jgi:tRNA pseudouridine55 synthase